MNDQPATHPDNDPTTPDASQQPLPGDRTEYHTEDHTDQSADDRGSVRNFVGESRLSGW